MATATIRYGRVDPGISVSPADGSTHTVGDNVHIVVSRTTGVDVGHLVINGVDYILFKTSSDTWEVDVIMPADELGVFVTNDTDPAKLFTGDSEFEDYFVYCRHVISSWVKQFLLKSPPADFGLIFPSGNWAWDVQSEIQNVAFSVKELVNAPQIRISDGEGGSELLHVLQFKGSNSYGLIDTGTPRYSVRKVDYGGGQVATWREFIGFSYGWRSNTVLHGISWSYPGGHNYPGGNAILDNLCIGVQAWSKHAVCGGFEVGLPKHNRDATAVPMVVYGSGGDHFGANCPSFGISIIPYDTKPTLYYFYVSFVRKELDGGSSVPTPQGRKRIFTLYHVVKKNTEIIPPHGTSLLEGGSVLIRTKALENNVLDLFTVDGVDKLTGGTTDKEGYTYFTKENINADVYVSATAQYVAPDATDGTPYSFQCTCPVCGTNTWSATGLPTGLSIDSSTGLISGTIPYGTAAADSEVEVTLVNNGNTVTRTFTLSNIYAVAPIPGVVWTALNKVAGAVTSIVEANDGSIIVCGDADIYRSTDGGVTFGAVKGGYGSANSLRKLASGTILCAGDTLSYRSTDNGATWSNVNNPGFAPIATDFVELPAGTIYMISGMGSSGATDIFKSTDDGANFSSFGTGYGDQYRIVTGKVEKTADGSLIVTQSFTGATRVLKETMAGPSLDQEYLVPALLDVRSAYFAVLSDGRIMGFFDSTIIIGDANGENWSVLEVLPDWGGLATPAVIGASLAETVGSSNGVWVAAKSGIATTKVFYSTDDWATRAESATVIDGDFSYKMVRLSTGTLLLGTNGATTNLWKSEP